MHNLFISQLKAIITQSVLLQKYSGPNNSIHCSQNYSLMLVFLVEAIYCLLQIETSTFTEQSSSQMRLVLGYVLV